MANRTIHQLLDLALYDGRFFKGTIRDWGPGGNHATWIAGREPTWRREVGQVVGLDYRANDESIVTPSITIPQQVSLEFTMISRSLGQASVGRLLQASAFVFSLAVQAGGPAGILQLSVTMGVGAAFDFIPENQVIHGIITRDGSDDGRAYSNGVPVGAPVAVGGNAGATTVTIGNRHAGAGGARAWDGLFFKVGIYGTKLDDDEAALLYRHGRIKHWPGAGKVEGIASV